MQTKQKIGSAVALARIKFLGERIPLAVRWNLTNKCPSRCSYCNLWRTPVKEMTTGQIFKIMDELAQMGTRTISFSGGEPTLRPDLGDIIDLAKQKGILPSMNSNGFGIAKRIKELKNLDLLKISLDGPGAVAAKSRGRQEAYDWAIEAAEAAKKAGIKFMFATTLTCYNKDCLEFMAKLAKKYKTMVAFQPLKTIYRGAKWNKEVYPTKKEWGKIMKVLRALKKKYPENVRNSEMLIDYINDWPRYKKIACFAGKVFCIIDPNGDVIPCDRVDLPIGKRPNCVELGFREAFARMSEVQCSGCGFCGAMELNFLLSLKPEAFYELGKRKILG